MLFKVNLLDFTWDFQGITLTSTATRRRPNALNLYFQLKLLKDAGGSAEASLQAILLPQLVGQSWGRSHQSTCNSLTLVGYNMGRSMLHLQCWLLHTKLGRRKRHRQSTYFTTHPAAFVMLYSICPGHCCCSDGCFGVNLSCGFCFHGACAGHWSV